MSRLHYGVSMSLDGFVAGKNQSEKNPLGVNGHLLHEWMRSLAAWRKDAGLEGGVTNASTPIYLDEDREIGAIIMGRNMFGGGSGPWTQKPWNGWWGENPPFHLPVFVLTHYPRPTLKMEGGTTFTFVTDGPSSALDLARKVAKGKDIDISGGAGIAKQFIKNGLIDVLDIHLVSVFLGEGVKLFDDAISSSLILKQDRVVEAPGVVHLRYVIER